MGASYVKLYVLSMLFSYIFLAGWYPILHPEPYISGLMTLVKALIIMVIGIFLRSVYPRYRIDQALRIGWHKLFTLSIISLILSLVLILTGTVR